MEEILAEFERQLAEMKVHLEACEKLAGAGNLEPAMERLCWSLKGMSKRAHDNHDGFLLEKRSKAGDQ